MHPLLNEWLNVILRWSHVIAGIMWIGDSFLFMYLDRNLEKPKRPREGDVKGELWMTHGGGFYELVKRNSLRPEELPEKLHWFKWESYSTWITGFFLITVVYYFGGQAVLAREGGPLNHGQAVALSLTLLFAGVGIYDLMCRTKLLEYQSAFALVGLAIVTGLSWGLLEVFTPRAAFLQVGAMIATVMSSNVFLRIIPAQKRMLAATRAGQPVDTSQGVRGKNRSAHNHYLTLPVLFLMLSNHFPAVYSGRWPWLTLLLIAVVGVGVKAFMNQRLEMPPLKLGATVAALAAVIWTTLPPGLASATQGSEGPPIAFAQVHPIIEMRCVTCHATTPSNPSFAAPPLGIVLETPEQIRALKDRILVRSVLTQTMPLGNLTGMTDAERELVGGWISQGADVSGGSVPRPAPAPQADPSPAAPKSPAEAAKAVFAQRCAMCHGVEGRGDGAAAASLTPRPRTLTDPQWQASVTDEHLAKVISEGGAAVGKSPVMPGNPDLANQPETVEELVKLVRSLGGR